jgi:hypothetical protein
LRSSTRRCCAWSGRRCAGHATASAMSCSVRGGRGTQEAAELVRILQVQCACLLGVAARGAARRGPRGARAVARCGRAQSRSQDDAGFVLRLELDSAQRLRRVFWRTPEQRRSDVLYHDCIAAFRHEALPRALGASCRRRPRAGARTARAHGAHRRRPGAAPPTAPEAGHGGPPARTPARAGRLSSATASGSGSDVACDRAASIRAAAGALQVPRRMDPDPDPTPTRPRYARVAPAARLSAALGGGGSPLRDSDGGSGGVLVADPDRRRKTGFIRQHKLGRTDTPRSSAGGVDQRETSAGHARKRYRYARAVAGCPRRTLRNRLPPPAQARACVHSEDFCRRASACPCSRRRRGPARDVRRTRPQEVRSRSRLAAPAAAARPASPAPRRDRAAPHRRPARRRGEIPAPGLDEHPPTDDRRAGEPGAASRRAARQSGMSPSPAGGAPPRGWPAGDGRGASSRRRRSAARADRGRDACP